MPATPVLTRRPVHSDVEKVGSGRRFSISLAETTYNLSRI